MEKGSDCVSTSCWPGTSGADFRISIGPDTNAVHILGTQLMRTVQDHMRDKS